MHARALTDKTAYILNRRTVKQLTNAEEGKRREGVQLNCRGDRVSTGLLQLVFLKSSLSLLSRYGAKMFASGACLCGLNLAG